MFVTEISKKLSNLKLLYSNNPLAQSDYFNSNININKFINSHINNDFKDNKLNVNNENITYIKNLNKTDKKENKCNSINRISPSFCDIINLLILYYLKPFYCCSYSKKPLLTSLISAFEDRLNLDVFLKEQAINKKISNILFTEEQLVLINKNFEDERLADEKNICNLLNNKSF